ncbi:MAG: hypothetical protein JWQ72_2387, partial [Polaromonas sp.]|nr:hypothetical protein [Polaromonas sp.]
MRRAPPQPQALPPDIRFMNLLTLTFCAVLASMLLALAVSWLMRQ